MTPGTRFSYLVVLRRHGQDKSGAKYACLCACGKEVHVRAYDLARGTSVSCGCVGALGRRAAANAARISARYRASVRAVRDEQAQETSDALAVLYGFARQEAA